MSKDTSFYEVWAMVMVTGSIAYFCKEARENPEGFYSQSGRKEVSDYFPRAKKGMTFVTRIDNLKFSDYIKLCCKEVER